MTVAAYRRAGDADITTAEALEAALRRSPRVHKLRLRPTGASFAYRPRLWPLLTATSVDVRLVGGGPVDIEVQAMRFSLGDVFKWYRTVTDAVEQILNQ